MSQQGIPTIASPFVRENGNINTVWYQLLISLFNRSGGPQGGIAMQTGSVAFFAAPTPPGLVSPATWLKCDHSAVSRTTYANLFALIGTTYGAGDGVTTFNVPNLSNYATGIIPMIKT